MRLRAAATGRRREPVEDTSGRGNRQKGMPRKSALDTPGPCPIQAKNPFFGRVLDREEAEHACIGCSHAAQGNIRGDDVNPGTSRDAARLMADRFEAVGILAQENAVLLLRQHFDERFVKRSRQGRHGIDQSVLRIFRELAPSASWSQTDQSWYRD